MAAILITGIYGQYHFKGEEAFLLGSGGFGRVYRGFKDAATSEEEVAVKVLKEESSRQVKSNEKELEILQKLQHKNIVQLIDYGLYEEQYVFIMELCHGSLSDLLKKRNEARRFFIHEEIRHILHNIISGLKLLHDENIWHRDIKPENILLKTLQSTNGKLLHEIGATDIVFKMADFGLSRFAPTGIEELSFHVGTKKYMAPEVKNGSGYDEKCDVYSTGILAYELYKKKEFANTKSLQFNLSQDESLVNLIRWMTMEEPNERIETNAIRSHNYFSINALKMQRITQLTKPDDDEAKIKEVIEQQPQNADVLFPTTILVIGGNRSVTPLDAEILSIPPPYAKPYAAQTFDIKKLKLNLHSPHIAKSSKTQELIVTGGMELSQTALNYKQKTPTIQHKIKY